MSKISKVSNYLQKFSACGIIVVKIGDANMSQDDKKPVVYSALEVANICGVVNQTAINWIKGGHLKAFKTPGGQFRVYPDDLAAFMTERAMRIPPELLAACSSSQFAPKSVLIVDDDKGLNNVLAKYIGNKFDGLQIFQAFDGFDAGAQMTAEHPTCVIIDLNLPGIDGFDLCRRIHENDTFGKPVIIVVTALEDASIEAQLKPYGVLRFFKKPLNLVEVCDAIASTVA